MVSGSGGLRRAVAIGAVLVAIGGLVLATSAMPMLADESPARSALDGGVEGGSGTTTAASGASGGSGVPAAAHGDDQAVDPAFGSEVGDSSVGQGLLGLVAAFASMSGFAGDLSADSTASTDAGSTADANEQDGLSALEGDASTLDGDEQTIPNTDDPTHLPEETEREGDTSDSTDEFGDGQAEPNEPVDSEFDESTFDDAVSDGDSSLTTDSPVSDGMTSPVDDSAAGASSEGSGGWFDVPLTFDGLGGALGSLIGGSSGGDEAGFEPESGGSGDSGEEQGDRGPHAGSTEDGNADDSIFGSVGDAGSDSDDPSADTADAAGDSTETEAEAETETGSSAAGDSPLERSVPGGERPMTLAVLGLIVLVLGYVLYRSDDPIGSLLSIPGRLLSLAIGGIVALSNAIERVIDALAGLRSIAELPGLVVAAILGTLASIRTRAGDAADSLGVTRRSRERETIAGSHEGVDPAQTARERIREAFDGVVTASSIERFRLRVATPADVARSAVDAGTPREPVETITDAFRDVEYGDRDPESRVDRVSTAREELRAAFAHPESSDTAANGDGETVNGGEGR